MFFHNVIMPTVPLRLSGFCSNGRRSSPLVVELAAEVVRVIAAAHGNPESVPEPDQVPAAPKRGPARALPAAAAPTIDSNSNASEAQGATRGSIDARSSAKEAAAAVQPAAVPLSSDQEGSKLLADLMQIDSYQRDETHAEKVAGAQDKPKAFGLQPKAIPALNSASHKPGGLFRQPAKSAMLSAASARGSTGLFRQAEPAPAASAAAERLAVPAVTEPSAAVSSDASGKAETAAVEGSGGATAAAQALPKAPLEAAASQQAPQQGSDSGRVQGLPMQCQPTALGAMFGSSKRAKIGTGAVMLRVSAEPLKPAKETGKVCVVAPYVLPA